MNLEVEGVKDAGAGEEIRRIMREGENEKKSSEKKSD